MFGGNSKSTKLERNGVGLMKKYIKIILPLVFGILTVFILNAMKVSSVEIYRIEFVMNAIITCVTTLAGFVLTSLSIIIGMSASPIMQKIRDDGGLPELVWIYSEALALSLIVIIMFIVLGANVGDDNIVTSKWVTACAGVLVSYISSMVVTSVYLLLIIAKIPSNKKIVMEEKPTVPPGKFR